MGAKKRPLDTGTLDAILAKIQELSHDGITGPNCRDYDLGRGDLPSRETLRMRGYSWDSLLNLAGMRRRADGRRRDGAINSSTRNVPAVVEAEIQAAFARGDHRPMYQRDWPLTAIPTGKHERIVTDNRTGECIKITSYYASIR